MKLLVVSPYFYPDGGGLENYVYESSRRLAGRGHEVTVVCATRGESKEEQLDGVDVIRVKPDFVFSNTPVKLSLYLKLKKIAEKRGVELISAHTPVPYFGDMAALVSRAMGTPFVLTYHSGSLMKNCFFMDAVAGIYVNTLEKFALSTAEKIIVYSEFVRDKTLFGYRDKIVYVPPGIDLDRFKPSSVDYVEKRILFVGQLDKSHRWKGLEYLIDAFNLLCKKDKSLKLTIVGSGNDTEFYTQMVEQLNLKSNVSFVGRISYDRIHEYYQKSSVLALPASSDAEALGMVLIEANACGLPGVGSKVGGIPHVIKDGFNGLLVPPKDAVKLADALDRILHNQDLRHRLRINAIEYSRRYNWNDIIAKLEDTLISSIR